MKELNVKLYHKANYYVIYNGDSKLAEGEINGRDIKEIVTDNGYKIKSLRIGVSYSYDVSTWYVEIK